MQEESKVLNFQQDADIKFEKLCEIVVDIETKGVDGDHTARQIVLTSVVKSENNILWDKISNSLLDATSSEMQRTVAAGLLMTKGIIDPLAQHLENELADTEVLGAEFEAKESLHLVLDGLVGAIKNNHPNKESYAESLFKLYHAACNSKSTAVIADQLLQRFINLLPAKSPLIDRKLLDLVGTADAEINSRLVSIDILGRFRPIEFYPTAEGLISNLSKYCQTNMDKLYFLDVLTKFFNNVAVSGLAVPYSSLMQILGELDVQDIAAGVVDMDTQVVDILSKRIVARIHHIKTTLIPQN